MSTPTFSATVLCLHGSQQTAEIFRAKLGNFIPKLKKICNVVFAEGPFECALREGDEVCTRTWFLRDKENKLIQETLDTSLRYIETLHRERGNIVGIIGFSMGGTLASIITAHSHIFPNLQFIIVAGAPDNDILSSLSIPPNIQSMHTAGKQDDLYESAVRLSQRFHNPIFISHDKGHIVPTQAAQQKQYLSFIESHISLFTKKTDDKSQTIKQYSEDASISTSISSSPQPSPQLCLSNETAASQHEEVEVLQAIYPKEIQILVPPPATAGDPCASISFRVPQITSDSSSSSKLLARFIEQLVLIISFTAAYPEEQLPIIDIATNGLSIDEIASARIFDLKTLLKSQVIDNAGTPVAFILIQTFSEWISSLNNEDNSSKAAIEDECDNAEYGELIEEVSHWEEEDEEKTSHWISLATQESYALAAKMKDAAYSDLHDDYNVFHEPPPPSARGIWRYTVGLLGKPSAGKSTFYNAVTRAALEREGRLMASVAPHPFTTIEPNVGPGWYASSSADVEADNKRSSLHGRDSQGRRLLPVVVKDVAGLVPGAYQGRGKGNRFLADLCDADVLIHVVDSSGRSDRDGNILDNAGDDALRSSPMEDAKWIREELHRWIHGNVIAKWVSVGRKEKSGDRISALFSGYKGPKSCVEKACRRAALDIDAGKSWTKLDVHRLVAHYLTIRFPICLALNKIDALPTETALETVRKCQRQAEENGEKAVPVSARAEAWFLLKQVAQDGSVSLSNKIPIIGSKEWIVNEDCLSSVTKKFGSTGVLDAISAAVSLRPPLLCYPVSDIDSEAPVGWSASGVCKYPPQLRDCLQFKPGSTVGDVYDALKRGALDHVVITGDFVRAEGKGIDSIQRKRQFGRETMLSDNCSVLRIQTNRKVVWQHIVDKTTSNS